MSFRILPKAVAVCVCALAQFSCATEHSGHSYAPVGQIPNALSISGTRVSVGMARGSLRDQAEVEGFRITQLPIRISDYQECVAKGVCSVSTETLTMYPEWSDASRSSEPATGLSLGQAKKYCEWLGARLPTLSEWLLAARGPEIARFPWGDAPPTCAQHWSGMCEEAWAKCVGKSPKECLPSESLATGTHPSGASPVGLQDVLLPRAGELVSGEGSGNPYGCGLKGGACLVASGQTTPGSIDYVGVPQEPQPGSRDERPQAFGFRCAWSGQ